jgi:hypothetical protein
MFLNINKNLSIDFNSNFNNIQNNQRKDNLMVLKMVKNLLKKTGFLGKPSLSTYKLIVCIITIILKYLFKHAKKCKN